MSTADASTVRARGFIFAAVGFGLLFAAIVLYGRSWRSWPELHLILETIAIMLALFAGLLALVRNHSRPNDVLLLVSATYLGTGVLDTYHMIVSANALPLVGSGSAAAYDSNSIASMTWSWLATRLFTSMMYLFTALWTLGPRGRQYPRRLRSRRVFGLVSLIVGATIVVLSLAPLPPAFLSGRMLAQPLELLAGLLFAVALIAYLRQDEWRQDAFTFWLVMSLLVNVFIQTLFMPFAALPFDSLFATAHVLKIVARACVIVGSAISMYELFRHAETSRAEIAAANAALQAQIRDRERAERENELHRQVFERSPVGKILYHMDDRSDLGSFRLISVNAAATRLTAATTEQVEAALGKTLREITPEAIDTEFTRGYLEVLESGLPKDFGEIPVTEGPLAGTVFTSTAFPLPDDHLAIFFQDVTEQARARAALRRREAQLADAQAVARIGSWEWDIAANTVEWSDEMYRVYGMDPDAGGVTYEAYFDHIHPDDRPLVTGVIQRSLAEHSGFDYDHRILRSDGEVRYVNARGQVILDSAGQPLRMYGTGQDITEAEMARQSLRASEAKFRAVAESTQEAIISAGADGRILYWNPSAERMFGYPASEAVGLPLITIIPERHREAHLRAMQRVITTGEQQWQGQSLELVGLRRDGNEFPLELALGILGAGDTLFVTATIRDVTARRAAEKANERYAMQLAASNRELQDFAFIASHDLQEPLRKILAFGDRLTTKYAAALDEEGRDYISRMQNAARRGQELVDSLLGFSRVTSQAQPFALTDLNQVVRDVSADLETAIELAGAQVQAMPLPTLYADVTQMRQLLQNLIGNALKFRQMDRPLVVTVSAEAVTEGDMAERAYRIVVADNGIGFEERYVDRIFQPLQRLHGNTLYPGTGMGLAICRKIVERHGGSITAQSQPGQGSRFIVTLPAQQQIAEEEGEP